MKCVTFFFLLLCFKSFTFCLQWKYHSNAEIEEYLKNYTQQHKHVNPIFYSIGKSTRNNSLSVVEVTKANRLDPTIPNIKLIGNIHGNEAVGREVLLRFLEYIAKNATQDPRIDRLLKNTRIHVLPTLNPDGYSKSKEDVCIGVEGRTNAMNFDLNRGFPDQFRTNRIPRILPEVEAVINWMKKIPFILSASLHSGALVANYPFDTLPFDGKIINESHPRPSICADDDVFKELAGTYARHHKTMHEGKDCLENSQEYPGGITNGAAWYPFKGGMQDYNYNQSVMEVTLEISCCKFPSAKKLPDLWLENKDALIEYSLKALMGVVGIIKDFKTHEPIVGAELKILGREMVFKSREEGQFWRILLPGNYTLIVKADGYYAEKLNFTVKNSTNLEQITIYLKDTINFSTTSSTTTTTTIKPTIIKTVKTSVSTEKAKLKNNQEPRVGESTSNASKKQLISFNLIIYFTVLHVLRII